MAEPNDDPGGRPGADALGATVRRSAVTDTVVPAALDETVLPAAAADALGATVRRSAVTDTVVPAAAAEATVLPAAAEETLLPAAGTDDTLAAASGRSRPPSRTGSTSEPSTAGSSTTLVRFEPEADTLRTVGDDLRHATVERFGDVADDRFEVLSELARGGLGQVLRARDPRTGRVVAIKQVLRPNRELVARFAREALVTANLQHPAIVPVYEVGRWHGGEPFYAMKLVRGRALDALIDEAKTSAARVGLVPHVIAIADALAYAHSEHVIHRDLKPANVLVGPYGETVVIDWGLARDLAGADDDAPATPATAAPGETVAGAVMGTPSYMPPEQAAGQVLDERADVYAIGAILYHVLAGVRPYHQARTVDGILAAVADGPPRSLAALAPDVAPELIAIADKAMARDRAARYPTAQELAGDLRRFQAGQLVGAHRYSSGELVRRWLRRHRAAAATGAVALAALAVFGVISVRRIAAERDRAREQTRVAERERAVARDARTLAERRLADSLEELGRQAAVAEQPERALPFLAGAAAASRVHTPALAVLLGQARLAYGGLRAVAPADHAGTSSGDLADRDAAGRPTLLVTVSGMQSVRAWDLARRAVRWTADDAALATVPADRASVITASARGEVVWRAADDGRELHRWPAPAPMAPGEFPVLLTTSPVGDRFAYGTNQGRVVLGARDVAALVEGPRHAAEVWTLVFSPDGAALASVAGDEPVAVRDPATGAIRARLAEPGTTGVACAWRDATSLVTVDSDHAARLWRVADRQVVRRYRHDHEVFGVIIAPGGARMLTHGVGDSGRLWALDDDGPGLALTGHRIAIEHSAFAGGRFVTADEAGAVLSWDPLTGERTGALPVEGPISGLRVDGDRLLVFGVGRPRVWQLDVDRPLVRLTGHRARIRDLAFDEAGQVVWSASRDGSARGARLGGGAVVLGEATFEESPIPIAAPSTAPPEPHGLRSLTLGPGPDRLLTAREDGAIELWDRTSGARVATWRGHTARARRVVLTADGRTAYSVGDTTLRRWDVATGLERGRASLDGDGWDVALVDGERRVATLTDGDPQAVALWDAATLARVPVVGPRTSQLRSLVPVDDGLLVAGRAQIVLLDRDGERRAEAAHGQAFAAALGLAGDTPVIAVSDSRGEVVLHDRVTLAPVRTLSTTIGVVAAVAFRPDQRLLALAIGQRVELWDPATGLRLATTPDVGAVVTQLAWSPDGRALAFAGGSGTVWLWPVPADDGAGIDDLTACASPLRLDQAALAAATFDPARCATLPPGQK